MQIDHMNCDVMVVDDLYRQPIGRSRIRRRKDSFVVEPMRNEVGTNLCGIRDERVLNLSDAR